MLLYTFIYIGLLIVCFTQSFYPIFMLVAMLVRQSRWFYPLFHQVDKTSKRHGGELVAEVLRAHGVRKAFTLPCEQVSPIIQALEKVKIEVVDLRHQSTAAISTKIWSQTLGIPGVAIVGAGSGLTNTLTAVKDAQMAESPVVVIAGAAATMLKGRGSLQDMDQISLLKSITKRCFTVDCIRDIVPTLREAFRESQMDVPGPVFVELPVDVLYPYEIIAEQFASSSPVGGKQQSIISKLIALYSSYKLSYIFSDAWRNRELGPLPVTVPLPRQDDIRNVATMLRSAKRPLLIVGSQASMPPKVPNQVAKLIRQLKVPVYLSGSARGLLGSSWRLQYRHARREAVREADLVILLGAVCDFRLSYGRILGRSSKVVSVNRSLANAKLNSGVFWNPTLAIQSDVGSFIEELACHIGDLAETEQPVCVDEAWLEKLAERDTKKDKSIENMASDESTQSQGTQSYANPLKVLTRLRDTFDERDDVIYVADGGDFVATASYILRPNGPMRWLDPGPFGTLGCGAGFALAAKLRHPDKQVVAVMGDGAFGYAIAELDTFVRHKVPVFWLIGNDACWTQIAREQVPMLGSAIGCQLAYTNYHLVAEGFGAKGFRLSGENLDKMDEAKSVLTNDKTNVVVNAIIGKSNFREGSISV